eukprot:6068281-Pleurochrysis_carterae.AAC.2
MIDSGLDARQQTWGQTWEEILKYAQRGDRGRSAKENAKINARRRETSPRESHPTLYPREVERDKEICKKHGRQMRNMRELTNRAKADQHRRETNKVTHMRTNG